MSSQPDITKRDIARYLGAYLDLLTNGKASFFIAFCDIEQEVFDALGHDAALFGDGISAAYLDSAEYHEAVLLRNDSSRGRIVLLAKKSVKHIDSLKHFSEYALLPQPQSAPEPWEILRRSFALGPMPKREADRLKRHFDIILLLKKPSLFTLFTYIKQCISPEEGVPADVRRLDYSRLNVNLHLLGCWRSEKKDGLLTSAELRKIIRNSQPEEIEKRLGELSLPAGQTTRLGPRQMQELRRMAFRSEYAGLFAKYPFETVAPFFKRTPRVNSAAASQDEARQWLLSCQQYFEGGYYRNETRKEMEARIFQVFDDEQLQHMMQYQAIAQRYEARFESALGECWDKIAELSHKVNSDSVNIRPESKRKLSRLLQPMQIEFDRATSALVSISPIEIPYALGHLFKHTRQYSQAYFLLLQLILKDELLQVELSSHGLLADILQLFLLCDGRNCYMPFYHPFFVVYLGKYRAYYDELIEIEKEGDNEELKVAMAQHAMRSLLQSFPVNTLLYDGAQYRFDNNLESSPFYLTFTAAADSGETSITDIDASLIYPEVARYIREHPYVRSLEILWVGDFSVDAIVTLEQKTRAFVESGQYLLDRITLNIATGESGPLRKQLDQLFADEQLSHRVRIRFVRDLFTTRILFPNEMHLIFVLDSQFLYMEPQLRPLASMGGLLRENLLRFTLEQFSAAFADGGDHISLLWDTLHSIELHNRSELSLWEYNSPNPKVFGEIGQASLEHPASRIVVFSSNTNASDYVFIKNHLTYFSTSNRGGDVLQMVFSPPARAEAASKEPEVMIRFSLQDVLDPEGMNALLNGDRAADEEPDAADVGIRFLLEKELRVEAVLPEAYKESVNKGEIKGAVDSVLRILWAERPRGLLLSLRKMVENTLYASCHTYAQSFLCHYICTRYVYDKSARLEVVYRDSITQNASFSSSKMKAFCNAYLSPNARLSPSEAELYRLRKDYPPAELARMADAARLMTPLTDAYHRQITTLLEKVKEYGQ